MALRIPIAELGGDQQIVGVYATTSRQKVSVLRDNQGRKGKDEKTGKVSDSWVQVARQGNPLFNEALVAVVDKDLYSRTSPSGGQSSLSEICGNPELAALLNAPGSSFGSAGRNNRTNGRYRGIYIPDMIKVDLSTAGVRLAGSGPGHPTNPDDAGFSRLSIFGWRCAPERDLRIRLASADWSPVAGPTGGASATMCWTSRHRPH